MFYPVGTLSSDPVALQSAQSASRTAREAGTKVERLQFEIERLLLISEALWGILKERHGYDDTELQQRVMEIDLRDGKRDGKVSGSTPIKCTACGKTISKRHPCCLYCGQSAPPNLFGR